MRLLAEAAAEREDYVAAERLLDECLRLAPGYSGARSLSCRFCTVSKRGSRCCHCSSGCSRSSRIASITGRCRLRRTTCWGHNERALQIHERMLTEFPESEFLLAVLRSLSASRRTARGRSRRLSKERAAEAAVRRGVVQPRQSKDRAPERRDIQDDAGAAGVRGPGTTIPACTSSCSRQGVRGPVIFADSFEHYARGATRAARHG